MLKFFMSMLFSLMFTGMGWWGASVYLSIILLYFLQLVPLGEASKIVGFNIYVDTLSFSLCYLTLWLGVLMLLASNIILKTMNFNSVFISFIMALTLILLVSFLTSNFMMFYFFFEASLIPTLLIIVGWGFQPERLQAGIYFMLYTLFASLPLLMGLFYYYSTAGSLIMYIGGETLGAENMLKSFLVSLVLVGAFLVKMPMFLVHLWLPKAHVEAPVAGSMILAGVLLKLGGYGLCRVMGKMVYGFSLLSPYIVGLSLFGMMYVGVLCCRLNDMKALVAYSSVAHMGLVLAGIFSGFLWGVSGGLMMMISHGISSSGLFCMVNVYYERMMSRSLFISKGLIVLFPSLSFMMFMLCGSNISSPPTINLLSEIFLMLSVLGYDSVMMVVFPLGSFFGAVFTFFLFSYSQHGKMVGGGKNFITTKFSDFHALIVHIIPLNFLVLKSEVFFLWL